MRSSFRTIVISCLAVATLYATNFERFAERTIDRLTGLFSVLLKAAAEPFRWMLASYERSDAWVDRSIAYDGPTIDLRHEAGASRLAAARGI